MLKIQKSMKQKDLSKESLPVLVLAWRSLGPSVRSRRLFPLEKD
jgi:hypothetical protein